MDAQRLGKTRSAGGGGGLRARAALALRSVGLLAALLVVLAAAPAGASAEPLCTDTWTGPAEGTWPTAADWSTGKVPSSSDVACIGSGKTVKVTEGTDQAGVVEGEGKLAVSGGTLEVSNALESSMIHALTLTGGTLTGAATFEVSSALTWENGATMSGTGTTALLSGASGTINSAHLKARTFLNEGTATITTNALRMSEGALLKNAGVLNVNPEPSAILKEGTGTEPKIVNTGTLQKTTGTGNSEIEVNFENLGTVNGSSGVLAYDGGSDVLASGSTLEGAVLINGATVTGGSFHAPNAKVKLSSGSLSINSASTATIGELTLTGGTQSGEGTLDVSSSLTWENFATMSGTGTTVLLSGASGTINSAHLEARTFLNEGTATITTNALRMSEGALLKNAGVLNVNPEPSAILKEGKGTEPKIVNTGTLQKTTGTGNSEIEVNFENLGTVNGSSGQLAYDGGSDVLASGGTLEGAVLINGATVTGGSFHAPNAKVKLSNGSLSINSASTATIGELTLTGGTQSGEGTLDVSSSLTWENLATMSGTGTTVLLGGASGTINSAHLKTRTFLNEGTATITTNALRMSEGALLKNAGVLSVNPEPSAILKEGTGTEPKIVNTGTLQKTTGTGNSEIEVNFENLGAIKEETGKLKIIHPVVAEPSTQYGGPENPSAVPGQQHVSCGKPVSCATGNESEAQTDFSIGGRGVGLSLTRTYNSQAGAEGVKGLFGYGWSSSFSDRLVVEKASKKATLVQANGSTVPFMEGSGEAFTAPAWTQDTLTGTESAGYTLTLADQVKYKFAGSSGRLESVTDRNGNETTLTYNAEGRLESITDSVGRKIKLKYNEGLVESAEDPMGHVVKYTYEGGNLKSVTQPAEAGLRWQFKYDGSHEMTEMIDGRGGKTINEYNGSHQVSKQIDPAEHKLKFEYEPFHTKITNENTGSVTDERFTSNDEPFSITRGFGTVSATTESFTYNAAGQVLAVTDGNGHTTGYGYNAAGDRTSMVDPDKDETKWMYNSTHDVETMTTPRGETTTIKRDLHGNPEVIERLVPVNRTQATKYKYGSHGEVESMTTPIGYVYKYEYDAYGDRTAEVAPEGDKRTWEYNEDSQEIATVSPRGNVTGGKPAEFTTKIEQDAQGRPIKVTDPLGHVTEYKYDGDGNVEKVTDSNKHITTYTYNGDNQPVKVEAPNKTVTETEYDGAGQVITQIDGNKQTTKYKRNAIEEVIEITDPLSHVTTKEYDGAGNLVKLIDPAKRTTTYTYDPANRLTEVSYSSGKPAAVKYEYDKDGDRTKMVDGTGTTIYSYDPVDRMIKSENGRKELVKYSYDLDEDLVSLTYPNGKEVARAFDRDGRFEKLTDWLGHVIKFPHDPDSDIKATIFPSETKNEDRYTYNAADQMTEIKMLSGTETIASLAYTRDNDGQVKKVTSKGFPGMEVTEGTYDESNRLTKYGSTEYKYDPANNPTKEGSSENAYNEGDELEKGTGVTYSYDELGERTKMTPSTGPDTTYGYDQAGELTSVERPKEGETPEINDSYEYNGDGLRTSQTINGTTSYLAWNVDEPLPLLLTDGTNDYIYGPSGLPVEQINTSTGTVTYLHHDQQGSTRLLTGSTGTVTGKCTYNAYGTPTCEGTATPLGYDGQYTSVDTGLIYMRGRVYDPTTGQFLTRDPITGITGEPYAYANDNPLNLTDPTGMIFGLPSPGQIVHEAGKIAENVGEKAVHVVEKAGEEIGHGVEDLEKGAASVGQYAAPALDATSAVVCVVASEGFCGATLVGNFLLQQFISVSEANYTPGYDLGLNEAALFATTGLGVAGLGAVSVSGLKGLGRIALGGSIAAPGLLLDLGEAFSSADKISTAGSFCGG